MTQPTNIEQLKVAARESYSNFQAKLNYVEREGKITTERAIEMELENIDEIVTSTYLQAVEDIKKDYGWMNDGCGCCMEKDLSTYLEEEIQSLKQTKDI